VDYIIEMKKVENVEVRPWKKLCPVFSIARSYQLRQELILQSVTRHIKTDLVLKAIKS
jgi:hypothetical protein